MAPGMIWGQLLPGLVQSLVSQATSSDVPLCLTGSNITACTGREKEKRDTKTEREATIMDCLALKLRNQMSKGKIKDSQSECQQNVFVHVREKPPFN